MWLTEIPLIGGLMSPLPELLAKSSFRLGLLLTVAGFGALVGSLFIAAVGGHRRGLLLLWSMLITGVALVTFSASPWYYLSLLIIPVLGVGQAGRMALSNALVQGNTEDAYRGRVMSIYMMEFGLNSVAVFGFAVLAGLMGVQWAIGGAGALLLVIAIYCLTSVGRIRNLD
jgi:MFS family permease